MTPDMGQHDLDSINNELERIFDEEIEKARRIHATYERLWQNLKIIGMAGGKRLRPRLLLQIAGRSDDATLKVAVAHELLHMSTLIHDDIIDNDDVRHGKKNLVGLYKDIYAEAEGKVDVGHFARSAALVAGDLLLSYSHKLITESGFETGLVRQLQGLLYRSVFEVIGGQLMDTEAPFVNDYYDPLQVYKYKTASYSFVGPILSGATIAGLDTGTRDALEDYANALGIAFQLRDDDLGVFGDSSVTGKSASQDLLEGKKTKLIELFMERTSKEEQTEFMQSFGKQTASEQSIEHMREVIESSGARAAHDNLIEEYLQKSLSAVADFDEPLQTWLVSFAHQNADRKL